MEKVQEFDIPGSNRERTNSCTMNLWTNYEVMDNYLSQLRADDWRVLLEQKKFDFRNDKLLSERVTMSMLLGLNDLTPKART